VKTLCDRGWFLADKPISNEADIVKPQVKPAIANLYLLLAAMAGSSGERGEGRCCPSKNWLCN